jgi:cobyrinic acid a,c-diamide synthase
MDCMLFRNVMAGYTHIHALGHDEWAENFVRAASLFKKCREDGEECPDIGAE